MATLEARLALALAQQGDDMQAALAALGLRHDTLLFSMAGACTVKVGALQVPLIGAGSILSVRARLSTAPTGATTFKVDVNKNGTTIYGTQANRPIWTAAANAATVSTHSVTTYADGDYLSVDVDAVGSTIAGSDLVVAVRTLRTS